MASKWVVCPRCEGEGYVSKIGAFTAADLDEQYGDDWEERDRFVEEYVRRGGAYDEVCAYCGGERVVPRLAEDEEPCDCGCHLPGVEPEAGCCDCEDDTRPEVVLNRA